MAGIEALNGPQDDMVKMVAEFKRRRDFIVDGLNNLPGFRCHKPDGAFYVFPNIEGTGRNRGARRHAPLRGGRGVPVRHRVRKVRRGLPEVLLRELDPEHHRGAEAHREGAEGPAGRRPVW